MKHHARVQTLLALAMLAGVATGQTVTVTTSSNIVDIDFFNGTIADLPGPDGKVSFTEALIATDNVPGHQTIGFAIPQAEWILQFIYPGRAVLNNGLDFRAFDTVTIDGTTQTAFTGDTNPDGHEVALYSTDLYLLGDNSLLIGFDTCAVGVFGANSVVQGNTGGLNIDAAGDNIQITGNLAGTIKVTGGNNVLIQGNTASRMRIWSTTATQIGGPALADRNYITGYGTFNSEGLPSGTDIELFQTQGILIENNYIGTTPDGLSQGNLYSNKGIEFAEGNVGAVVRNNLIAGILGHGQFTWAGTVWGWAIFFQGSGSDIELTGNTIGLDAAGMPTLPSVWGVDIGYGAHATYSNVRLGGPAEGQGNTIAGHYFSGVTVGKAVNGVRLANNSIYGNSISAGSFPWLGIDLVGLDSATGVTLNDALDVDTGGNDLQNYPLLSAATRLGPNVNVVGSLDSSPSAQFTVEFFGSSVCNDTGFGEGELPLGTTTVFTDAGGHADFDVSLASSVSAGWYISSTATLEPLGATSEFSACLALVDVEVGQTYCYGDGSGSACPCANTGAPGHGCASSQFSEGALLLASGSLSVGADALALRVESTRPSQPGLFFQGTTAPGGGLGILFGDGLRCAGGQVIRLQVVNASPAGVAESSISVVSKGAVGAGQSLNYQWWYRDPNASPCGSGFNLSNGVALDWTP